MNMLPDAEATRLQALKDYDILDTPDENEFDRLTELASIICGTPISLITLLDDSRQWFKAKKGFDLEETPRNISFCQYTIQSPDIFQIEDTLLDDGFVNNPLVTDYPNIRFYAGFPLLDPSGNALGALCVMDTKPNTLNATQASALRVVSEEVMSQIIARKERKELKDYERLFSLTTDMISISTPDQYLKKINPAFSKILGWSEKELLQQPIPTFLHPADIKATQQAVDACNEINTTVNLINRIRTRDDEFKIINWITNFDHLTGLRYGIGRDITLEKETEINLIHTKEMLEAISQVGKVGGWELDLLQNTNTWSYVTKEIHEVPQDFVPDTETALNFYREGEHRNEITRLVQRAIKYGESFEAQLQLVTAKGNLRWVKAIGHSVVENGGCVRVYGILQDITNEKNKEQIISLSEKRFRQTFDYAPTGMFISNPFTAAFIEVNEALSNITGYSKHELIDMNYSEVIHPDDLVKFKRHLKELLVGKVSSVVAEKRLVTKKGATVWVQMVASLVRGENGMPLNVIGQVQDITLRINAERQLLLSEEKHRGFFEHSQGLMCTHDLCGNFLTVNPAGAELLGYTIDDFIGKSLYDIVAPEHGPMVTEYLQQIEMEGHHKGMMKLLHKNGISRTWMYNNVVSELIDGRKYVIGNAVDMTERIAMEKDLHKAKELAVHNAHTKDVFLANMSHEIRTPINAITGFADLLIETRLEKEQIKYVSNISTAGENLLNIINDILDFSKIESGFISLESIPFNLKEVLDNVNAVLSHKANEKKLSLSYTTDKNLVHNLTGDPTRLTQVLINLANNAIKFTNKGSVQIKVAIDNDIANVYSVRFSVIDTGIGIKEDKLDSIFKRFTQADTDTTRKYGGTGLGLSISKSLIELQNGKIWVESILGVGSSFNFIIPYKKTESSNAALKEKKYKKLFSERRIKVLLVEDNLFNQQLAIKVLENFNFLPELAQNGRVAIEMAGANNYDIILMDLQMPEMDGYHATQIIRDTLKITTPIIAMTAHSLVGEKDRCIAVGMNDYIAKPFVQENVFNKIMFYASPDQLEADAYQKEHASLTQLTDGF